MTTQPVDATVDGAMTAGAARARAWREARRPTAPPELGYDTLGRRRSRKPRLRVAYEVTPAGEAALDGGRWWLTLAGYAALGPDGA